MTAVKALGLILLAWFASTSAPLRAGAVIREPGAIYLEDLLAKPLRMTTIADAPIYYKIDLERYLGTLRKGQVIELQAVSDGAYRVRGQAQQGQVAGWVEPRFLNPLRPEFLANLKQNAVRLEEVRGLIAKNEVAINMTPEEVTESLGKPAKTTSRLDASGRAEVWEFVRYDRVPQTVTGYDRLGNLATNTVYVKVPAGKLAVTFSKNLVSALEQTEGTFDRDARAKIVAVPFDVRY